MATCHGTQHTSLCGVSIILCALFHVHLHSAHAADMGTGNWEMSSQATPVGTQSDAHSTGDLSIPDKLTKLLFEKYATGDVMTIEEFEKFLSGIGLGQINHGSDDADVSHSHHLDSHINENVLFSHDTDDSHNSESDSHNSDSNVNIENSDVEENISNTNSSSKKRRSVLQGDTAIHKRSIMDILGHRESVHVQDKVRFQDVNRRLIVRRDTKTAKIHDGVKECLDSADYLGLSASEELTAEAFEKLFPVFLYQLDSDICKKRPESEHHHSTPVPFWSLPASVWLCSLLAITVISLVGLLAVAIIPLTSKVIYNHLLQFLVALAVGSLTGDACLHLLPHALGSSGHSHGAGEGHDHSSVFKGLVALAGIYIFFIIERLMKMYSTRKQKLNKKKRETSMGAQESSLMAGKEGSDVTDVIVRPNQPEKRDAMSCEKMLMVVHKDVKQLAQEAHDDVHRDCDVDVNDAVGGHGHHSHAHGPLPRSIAQVAWMVIMGDGIHNFGDGLAIGVAFASSISVGLSTTVAVFCHELPHEIGDFAVLLRAGMSAKQAILYNILSSILAVIGMLIGLLVGNLSSASLWIFALIGGMFIYVALVDMMPELTAVDPKTGEHPLVHFMLQNAGMLLGFTIMLLIGIYEDDIKIQGL